MAITKTLERDLLKKKFRRKEMEQQSLCEASLLALWPDTCEARP